jgi:hypothetical protein
MQFQKGVPINRAASTKDPKEGPNPDIVPFESDEILQCTDPSETRKRKRRKNVDIEEVSKSCLDLEIDG